MPANPIDLNFGKRGGAAVDNLKNGASAAKSKCCETCCSKDVKEQLDTLVQYAATIIIALAWFSLMAHGIFYNSFGNNLTWMWIFAGVMILLAMAVCYVTGETLAFGEDCC